MEPKIKGDTNVSQAQYRGSAQQEQDRAALAESRKRYPASKYVTDSGSRWPSEDTGSASWKKYFSTEGHEGQ